jgi:hypothetical protein
VAALFKREVVVCLGNAIGQEKACKKKSLS